MSLPAIRDQALRVALSEVGVREQGGNNCGPEVEKYLAAVGLPPGQPWCCAFVYWCYREATIRSGGALSQPLPRTGKVAHLWQRTQDLWRSNEPTAGAIFIHLVDPSDPESDGHCGIVTSFTDRTISAVEGNTNAAGSRNGDRVRVQLRKPEYVIGYIDIGREGPTEVDSQAVA